MNAASAGRMRCPVGCELKLNSSATCSFNVRSWAVCLGQDGSAPTLPCMQILKRFRVDPYLRLPTLRPQWGRGEVRSQIRSYRYGLTFDIVGTWVLCGLRFVRFRLQALSVELWHFPTNHTSPSCLATTSPTRGSHVDRISVPVFSRPLGANNQQYCIVCVFRRKQNLLPPP